MRVVDICVVNMRVIYTHKFLWRPHQLSDGSRDLDEPNGVVDFTHKEEEHCTV